MAYEQITQEERRRRAALRVIETEMRGRGEYELTEEEVGSTVEFTATLPDGRRCRVGYERVAPHA